MRVEFRQCAMCIALRLHIVDVEDFPYCHSFVVERIGIHCECSNWAWPTPWDLLQAVDMRYERYLDFLWMLDDWIRLGSCIRLPNI